jgi:hypothetical protein
MDNDVYEQTQQGTTIVAILLVMLAIEAFFAVYRPSPVPWVAAAVCVAVALVFSSMTIAVSNDSVRWWLAFGLFRQRLPLTEIEAATAVRVPFWRGLGIRTANGRDWLWIVSGRSAVTCTLRSGKRISLGSADALRLAKIINERIA